MHLNQSDIFYKKLSNLAERVRSHIGQPVYYVTVNCWHSFSLGIWSYKIYIMTYIISHKCQRTIAIWVSKEWP